MSTIFSRNNSEAAFRALVQQYNALNQATLVTSQFHRDISGVAGGDFRFPTSTTLAVSAATAVDLPTTLALAKNIQGVCHVHLPDDAAHLLSDNTYLSLDGYAIDNTSGASQLSSVILLLNAAKAIINVHYTASGVHVNNDATNTISTAGATDLASSETLANAIKTKINAHILSGPSVGRIKLTAS